MGVVAALQRFSFDVQRVNLGEYTYMSSASCRGESVTVRRVYLLLLGLQILTDTDT